MKYILSEEEYKTLKTNSDCAKALMKSLPNTRVLQEMCTKISNEWASWKGWDGKGRARPWGCIITAQARDEEWYCDNCPVRSICPNENKEWSK